MPDPIVKTLPPEQAAALLDEIAAIIDAAPFFRPLMPRWGTPFSVQMSNCGPLGWVADKSGYRYQPQHPVTGAPWPPASPSSVSVSVPSSWRRWPPA